MRSGRGTGAIVMAGVAVLGAALLAGTCRKTGAVPDEVAEYPVDRGMAELAGAPFLPGNALELVENGEVFDVMERDIRAARHSVNIVVFIWRGEEGPSERLGAALLERREGVACRILVDPFGSMKFSKTLRDRLEQSGCLIRRYNARGEPLARNHRKIQVVDGRIGVTGGYGIWKSWEGQGRTPEEWRDTAVRVRGPAVAQMQRAFEQNWVEDGGDPLPASDYPKLDRQGPSRACFVASSPRRGEPSAAELMTHVLVANAERSLWIANSYFIPDDLLRRRLIEARQRGVDVRILAPGPVHDVPPVRAAQRNGYRDLLPAGIRIYEYEASMMHAKTMVVDGRWVVIGSTNFDALSFAWLEEGSLVADAPWLARKLQDHIEQDLKFSKEITQELWEARDLLPEVGRNAAGFLSDWL